MGEMEKPAFKRGGGGSRYSCFCLDIGVKGYDPIDGPSAKKYDAEGDLDNDPEIKPKDGKELGIERYYRIFSEATSLTLPLFKLIASYFFVDYRWLVNLEKEGLLVNKYTWITGTKHQRRLYFSVLGTPNQRSVLGIPEGDGINLTGAYLYWTIPGKSIKKKRRTVPLKGIEDVSTGKVTLTFGRGQSQEADASRCFSISFLHNHTLPGTKIQRKFLRTLDFEVANKKIRNQIAFFLTNFLWIYKDK